MPAGSSVSVCQTRRASAPSRSSASSASRSSFEPGKTTTAIRGRGSSATALMRRRGARSRSSRSAGSRAAARTSARPGRAPRPRRSIGSSSSTSRPTLRVVHGEAEVPEAALDRLPLRVEDARLRPDEHGRLHPSTDARGRRGSRRSRSRSAARTPRRSGRACPRRRRPEAPGPGSVLSQPSDSQ